MFKEIDRIDKILERERPDIGHDLPIFARGRLTLTSATPVTIADVLATGTLYFTPYVGCYEFTEISLNLAGYVINTNFDIFYTNHALYSLAWASDVARATALARSQGYLRLSTALERVYLGTIRTTGVAGQCEDSVLNRFVWNNYNRVPRVMYVKEATNHIYNGAARKWNNSDVNNLLQFIAGLQENDMHGDTAAQVRAGADASYAFIRPYLNGAQIRSYEASNSNVQYIHTACPYAATPRLGFNSLQTYELGNHAASTFNTVIMSFEYEG